MNGFLISLVAGSGMTLVISFADIRILQRMVFTPKKSDRPPMVRKRPQKYYKKYHKKLSKEQLVWQSSRLCEVASGYLVQVDQEC